MALLFMTLQKMYTLGLEINAYCIHIIPFSGLCIFNRFNVFDNHLFGINNMEAESMDPQQKLLVECTYKALEDAGVPVEAISGTKTGVFVGKKISW